MAQLPVWNTIRAAAGDVAANKASAAGIYAIFLAVTVLANLPVMLLPGAKLLNLLPLLLGIGASAWLAERWAEFVVLRAIGATLGPNRFWPTLRALLKYYIIVGVGWLSAWILVVFSGVLMRLSPVVGLLGATLALAIELVTLIAAVRLSLVPARAAIGEGTSLGAGWKITKGSFWRLVGLGCLIVLAALLVDVVMLGVTWGIAGLAVHLGRLVPPPQLTVLGIAQWLQLPGPKLITLLSSIVVSPLSAAFLFLVLGSLIRAALLLGPEQVQAEQSNPWHVPHSP